MKSFLNSMKSLVIVAALLVGGGTAQASIGDTYSDTFQGVTFTFNQTDADTLTFRLQGTLGGDWSTANYLGAFDLKDLGLNFNTVTGTANGPGAVNLAGLNEQLSASSVDCNSAASPKGSICFDIAPDLLLTQPFSLTYTIDFSSALNIASTGPHLQIAFTETSGGPKVGSLYSEDVGRQVPEPASGILSLVGLGLMGAGFRFRRRSLRS